MGLVHRAILVGGAGLAASAITGCGSSGGKWLSAYQSSRLIGELNSVQTAMNDSDCAAVTQALQRFRSDLNGYSGLDATLLQRLNQGASTIATLTASSCQSHVPTPPKKKHKPHPNHSTTSTTTSTPSTTSTTSTTTTPTITTSTTPLPTTTTGGQGLGGTTTTGTNSTTTPTTGGQGLGDTTSTSGVGPGNGAGAGNGASPGDGVGTGDGNGNGSGTVGSPGAGTAADRLSTGNVG